MTSRRKGRKNLSGLSLEVIGGRVKDIANTFVREVANISLTVHCEDLFIFS